MAKKVKARQPRPPIRRRILTSKPKTTTVSAIKNLWDVVKPAMPSLGGVHEHTTFKCDVAIQEQKSSEVLYHDITTKWATWPSGAHVDFTTWVGSGGFGAGIPVYYAKTATGYSFKGQMPVCTATAVCTNGQKIVWQVDIEGTVNTSVTPDEMSYKYSVDVFCGNDLSCNEFGSFTGQRKTGTEGGLEGSYYGKQEWIRRCCPKQQKLT